MSTASATTSTPPRPTEPTPPSPGPHPATSSHPVDRPLATIFDVVADGIVLQDASGTIVECNPAALRILGLTRDQLTGRTSIDPRWSTIHADGSPYPGPTHPAVRTLRTGQPVTDDLMGIHRPDGELRWITINTRAVFAADGTVSHVVVSFSDITALYLNERRLERAHADAQQAPAIAERATLAAHAALEHAEAASRSKSLFLANMSHEIRTPMTAILGFTDVLTDPSLSPADHSDFVDTIRRNGRHLLAVLNDILDMAKIESGKLTVERLPTDPRRTVHDVALLLRPAADEKALAFTVDVDPAVPTSFPSDPTRLKQILLNLTGNALKFTAQGSVRIAVSSPPTTPPTLLFSISDTGIGIPPERLPRLFTPFEQADPSTTRQYGGTGLGLSISAALTQALGGSLSAQSTPGQGSTFTLSLPAT